MNTYDSSDSHFTISDGPFPPVPLQVCAKMKKTTLQGINDVYWFTMLEMIMPKTFSSASFIEWINQKMLEDLVSLASFQCFGG